MESSGLRPGAWSGRAGGGGLLGDRSFREGGDRRASCGDCPWGGGWEHPDNAGADSYNAPNSIAGRGGACYCNEFIGVLVHVALKRSKRAQKTNFWCTLGVGGVGVLSEVLQRN